MHRLIDYWLKARTPLISSWNTDFFLGHSLREKLAVVLRISNHYRLIHHFTEEDQETECVCVCAHACIFSPGLSWLEKHLVINSEMFSWLLWGETSNKLLCIISTHTYTWCDHWQNSVRDDRCVSPTWFWSLWHRGGPAACPPRAGVHKATEPCSSSWSPGHSACTQLEPNNHMSSSKYCQELLLRTEEMFHIPTENEMTTLMSFSCLCVVWSWAWLA